MSNAMLQPVVVLIGWSIAMLVWMLTTRLPAMRAAGIDLGKLVGTTGASAERALPAHIQWKAHNYNHLLEQPTLFYAVALTLAIAGAGDGAATWLAWAYVALRIAHSLVQATVNRVAPRFLLFVLSSLALAGLFVLAVIAVF